MTTYGVYSEINKTGMQDKVTTVGNKSYENVKFK
jgi:hypothetical protein